MMALHIVLMVILGYYFIYICLDKNKLLPPELDTAPIGEAASVYYWRSFLFFVVGGISQILPYLGEIFTNPGDFWSIMTSPGLYSSRFFTPGLTEFVEPLVWITYGLYALVKSSNTARAGYETVGDAATSVV